MEINILNNCGNLYDDISYIILDYKRLMEHTELINRCKGNWKKISRCKLSDDFINIYKEKLWWELVSRYQQFNENHIEKYEKYINWEVFSEHQKITEKIIEKYADKLCIILMSYNRHIPLSERRQYHNSYRWETISCPMCSK